MASVRIAEISSEPRQPRRLEKKTNIRVRPAQGWLGPRAGAGLALFQGDVDAGDCGPMRVGDAAPNP
jgi:hypothetical protein